MLRRLGLAVVALVPVACDPAPCDDRCGPGTRCQSGKCVVEEAPAVDTTGAARAAAPDEGRRKGRRKGRRGRGRSDADGPATASAPVFDDSAIPRFDPNRVQTIGEGQGSERLSDRKVRQQLERLEPRFNRCIEQVASAGVEVGSGQVSFEIGIEPSGKVWGITATAPKALRASGVVACMRGAIHGHRFPSWDGPPMGVDYSFDVR
jgi:hypothetical protein